RSIHLTMLSPNPEGRSRMKTIQPGRRICLPRGSGLARGLVWLAVTMSVGGCFQRVENQGVPATESGPIDGSLVIYSALDREFAEPVLKDLARQAGIALRSKFDVESTKTVGLTNMLIAESVQPRCDLFWNNEILNTIRLKERGLLQPYRPRHAEDVPAAFKDPDGNWFGFAARARILLVNTRSVSEADRPKGLADLVNPRWKGKIGIAKPLFGTTATQAACLFAVWGEEKAKAFYPDREPGQLGTLFIPNTLAMLKGAPHPEAARRLADLIVSPDVEAALAQGPSAQIPLLKGTKKPAQVETPATVHPMNVDFQAAAKLWNQAAVFLTAEFAE